MGLSRREFLAVLGGAGTGYGLSRIPLRRLVRLDDQVAHRSVPGVERWIRTTCQICPGACGMEVRTVDGQPVGVRGNRLHPISRGGLCPVGAESLHLLYSPDRIKAPLKRAGERGAGRWKRVSWESALKDVASRIRLLRAAGEPQRVQFLDGYGRGLLSRVAQQFMEAIGSSGYFVDHRRDAVPRAMELAQGIAQIPAYDLENARTVLSFGVPLLEGWESPVQGQRTVGGIRRTHVEGRHRTLIQLDVKHSKTAQRADRFVPVQPGSYGAVALSIAYVLISQELLDREYLSRHVFGFEDWTDDSGTVHTGFERFVLEHCRPQDLESVTGLPAKDILEIAKPFGRDRPSLAIMDGSVMSLSNGVHTAWAIQALNALVGAVDRPGGSLLTDPVPFASPFTDEPTGTRRDAEDLLSVVQESGRAPAVLFLLHANPIFSAARGGRFRELFGDDTLVVSFTPVPDESSDLADYILPDHTFFERWQDAVGPRTYPHAVLGVSQPVVPPVFDTRNSGEVLLDLVHRAVPESKENLPWTSFQQMLKVACRGLFAARRGSVFTTETQASEIREMEHRGWWIPAHDDAEGLWDELLSVGGWWDPGYPYGLWGRVFRTSDRRFALCSRHLTEEVGDTAHLPRFEAPRWQGEKGAGSLVLHLIRPLVPNTAVAASLPWVRELMNPRVAWETWLDIHPEDAARASIESGDLVDVVARGRSFRARALVSTAVQPGIVVAPYGLGRKGGAWAGDRGTNPNAVVAPQREATSGHLEWQGTRVRILKASGGTHA